MFIFIVLGCLGFVNAVVNDAEVYYSLDDVDLTSGNPGDLSGNGNNGTNNGATTGVTGILGEAFSMDGINDWINTNYNPIIVDENAINFWRKSTETTANGFGVRDSTVQEIQVLTNIVAGGIRFNYNDGTNLIRGSVTFANLNDGNWHMISISYKLSTNTIDIYVDGNKLTTTYTIQETPSGGTYDRAMAYGALIDAGGNPSFFMGDTQDELAFYLHTFTQTDVDTLWNSGAGFNPYATPEQNATLNFTNITANDVTLVNDTTFITNLINFETFVLNTSTNGNVNHSYSLNGNTSVQYCTNTLDCNVTLNLTVGNYNISFFAFNNETNVTSSQFNFLVVEVYPYDVQNAIYNGTFLDIIDQDTNMQDVIFNSGGSKMFAIGATNDLIYEYDCSTNYLIDTCVYSTRNLSVSSEDTNPRSVVFNNVGSKVYMLGILNNFVYEYDCSTNFKIDTCTYSTRKLSVSSQETSGASVEFNSVGSKVYIVGNGNNEIFEYDCSTNFKIDTCTYSTRSLDVSSQDIGTTSVEFNGNGSKVYTVGIVSNKIFEYDCSIEYKIDTCSYINRNLDISGQDTIATGMTFNNDGGELYITGNANDRIFQYDIPFVAGPAPEDSCTPPAINNNWIINSTDNCYINGQTIDLGTGGIYYTDSGNLTFNNSDVTSSFFERLSGDTGTDTQVYLFGSACMLQ